MHEEDVSSHLFSKITRGLSAGISAKRRNTAVRAIDVTLAGCSGTLYWSYDKYICHDVRLHDHLAAMFLLLHFHGCPAILSGSQAMGATELPSEARRREWPNML